MKAEVRGQKHGRFQAPQALSCSPAQHCPWCLSWHSHGIGARSMGGPPKFITALSSRLALTRRMLWTHQHHPTEQHSASPVLEHQPSEALPGL